jgi:predicted regulator of Ras-like GTPase activity (Roadblock/LC7/MglB family)
MHALKALWPGSTIKRLFGSQPAEAKPVAAPTPVPAAKPQAPVARVQTPPPMSKVPAPKPVAPVAPAAVIEQDNLLHLPLKPIFERLSPALKALANAEQISDADEIALPTDNILPQLTGGVVRISFGELRNAARTGIFAEQNSHDYTLIDIPLSEVVARLNPSLLSLRADRKRVEVPKEVTGVFGKNGAGTAVIAAPEAFAPVPRETKPAQPAAPAASVAQTRSRVVIPPPPPGGDIIQFKRAEPAATPAPAPAPAAPSPIAMPPKVNSKPAAPAPAPAVQADAPIAMPAMAKVAAPAPASAPAAPAKPEPPSEPLNVPLAGLTENWPAAIKAELEQARPAPTTLAIPLSRLEGPMKTGRLSFAWSELRGWMKPTPLAGNSAQGNTQVHLALNAIAPLFFAHPARNNVAKKKAEIATDIPDVFGSSSAAAIRELAAVPVPKVNAPAAPTAGTPAPVDPAVAQNGNATNLQLRMNGNGNGSSNGHAAPAARMPELTDNTVLFGKKPAAQAPAPAAPAKNGHDANGFPKIDWTPEQVVKITCATPGVAGTMIAAEDGLMVATQLPAQFKSEALSAFLPQIFGRAASSAAELQLPALAAVRLTFGDQQCEIFKTGKLYYVIIGKPGEELPTPFLRKVAAELTKRN